MNDLPPQDPRRRLRELLAIPERDRTDEQWDELIEIEITLAPGNRESERPLDRQPEKRPSTSGQVRRPEQRKTGPRPAPQRSDPRPSAARSDPNLDAQTDARPPDPRPPKRHVRRPRRPPETPNEG